MMCKSMAANKREGAEKQEKTKQAIRGGKGKETESRVYYTNEEKGASDQ